MKLSLIFATFSAAEATKNHKTLLAELKEYQTQEAKHRVSNIDENMLQDCGGKPALQSNVESIACFTSHAGGIICYNECPDGWISSARGWAYCNGSKWNNELSSCVPMCSDTGMSEALKTLPSNVIVNQDSMKRGFKRFPEYELPVVKFSCDRRNQLTIKDQIYYKGKNRRSVRCRCRTITSSTNKKEKECGWIFKETKEVFDVSKDMKTITCERRKSKYDYDY